MLHMVSRLDGIQEISFQEIKKTLLNRINLFWEDDEKNKEDFNVETRIFTFLFEKYINFDDANVHEVNLFPFFKKKLNENFKTNSFCVGGCHQSSSLSIKVDKKQVRTINWQFCSM